jgi:hypothetical protein
MSVRTSMICHENTKTRNEPSSTFFVLSCFRGDTRFMRWAVIFLALAAASPIVMTQTGPVNDAPNPYRAGEKWTLPDGRMWGSLSAVDIDRDGRSIWVAERCGGNSACLDSGDRNNNRIQILDQDGRFIEEWTSFSRPSGLFIDKADNIFVADSESGSVARNHPGWKRGIDRGGRFRPAHAVAHAAPAWRITSARLRYAKT